MVNELGKLPNIGESLQEKLKQVGIETVSDLRNLGSVEAFRKIKNIDGSACYNMLCSLEGAIQGVRWHDLSKEDKEKLKESFKLLEYSK